jgi:hypothetical protein
MLGSLKNYANIPRNIKCMSQYGAENVNTNLKRGKGELCIE